MRGIVSDYDQFAAAVSRLAPLDVVIVYLRSEEWTMEEIGAVLCMSRQAVWSRLDRVRGTFAECGFVHLRRAR